MFAFDVNTRNTHWALLVVGNLDQVKEVSRHHEPLIMFVDSMGGLDRGAVSFTRRFLSDLWTWNAKRTGNTEPCPVKLNQLEAFRPRKDLWTRQVNGSDCGVFLCMSKAMALERGRLSCDSDFRLMGEDANEVAIGGVGTHVGVLRLRNLMRKRMTAFAIEYTRYWLSQCPATDATDDAPVGSEHTQIDPVWLNLPRVLREVLLTNFQRGILPCPMHLPLPGVRILESRLPVSALVKMDMRLVDLWGGSKRPLQFSGWSEHIGFNVNATLRKNGQLGLNCGNIASYSAAEFLRIFHAMHLAAVQSEPYTGPSWMTHPVEIEAAKQELVTRSNQTFHQFYTEVNNQGRRNRPAPESNWTADHPMETARSLTGTEIGILLAHLMGWARPGDDEAHVDESHLLFENTSWEGLLRFVADDVYKATQTGFEGCQRVLISNDVCSEGEGDDSHWFAVAYSLSAR